MSLLPIADVLVIVGEAFWQIPGYGEVRWLVTIYEGTSLLWLDIALKQYELVLLS